MKIAEKLVVSMDYTLKNDSGKILDTSEGKDPLRFIFGAGMIIPGLEKELEGKETGEKLDVSVQPAEGYGEYDESRIIEVGKEQFQEDSDIQKGMQVQAQDPEGRQIIFTVSSISDDKVTLDGNHPLAGQVLNFSVEIGEVREATKEEMEHGHVH
ncbi:MAG: peptidylprolyl isomerase [Bacteroidetes bacterium]|nr:peptidylprolyl isomerase [Bacteroidota bacterium]